MKTLEFSGRVFSGLGEGTRFVGLDWVQDQLMEKVGFKPFPGTLNLRLSEECTILRSKLEKTVSYRICSPIGYCSGITYKARVEELNCAIVIPEIRGYPKDVLEIIAPFNLRELLKINDGDKVSVSVCL